MGTHEPHARPMTLDERRALVIEDIIDDEENFAEGTVSWQCLEFFKWVQANTDIFDPDLTEVLLEDQPRDEQGFIRNQDIMKMDDETIKEFVKGYLNNETRDEFYAAATVHQTKAMCAADCGCAGGQLAVECHFQPNCGVCKRLNKTAN